MNITWGVSVVSDFVSNRNVLLHSAGVLRRGVQDIAICVSTLSQHADPPADSIPAVAREKGPLESCQPYRSRLIPARWRVRARCVKHQDRPSVPRFPVSPAAGSEVSAGCAAPSRPPGGPTVSGAPSFPDASAWWRGSSAIMRAAHTGRHVCEVGARHGGIPSPLLTRTNRPVCSATRVCGYDCPAGLFSFKGGHAGRSRRTKRPSPAGAMA